MTRGTAGAVVGDADTAASSTAAARGGRPRDAGLRAPTCSASRPGSGRLPRRAASHRLREPVHGRTARTTTGTSTWTSPAASVRRLDRCDEHRREWRRPERRSLAPRRGSLSSQGLALLRRRAAGRQPTDVSRRRRPTTGTGGSAGTAAGRGRTTSPATIDDVAVYPAALTARHGGRPLRARRVGRPRPNAGPDGGVHRRRRRPGASLRRDRPRATPTAPSRPTPGTSVTAAAAGHRRHDVAHLRRPAAPTP